MDPRVRLTLRLIDEGRFRLAETSRMMGLSSPYLMRLFHKEVGKTIRRYAMEARMRRAAQLLKQHSHPIKRVASECGYSDISNFYRDFKTVHTLTPKDLRLQDFRDLSKS